jgi:hypothetical protein
MYGEGVSNTSVNETELHLSKHIINLIQNNFSSEAILSIINKDNTVSEMNADILDLLGRKVKNICKNLTLYPNLNNINISFQELTVGTYFIAININEYRVIIPFLIY